MLSNMASAGLLAALALTDAVSAVPSFRMGTNSIVFSRIDPIVNPGVVGTHVHEIRGGSRFRDVLDSNEDMLGAQCSSINIQEDKSNYWAPALYFIHPNQTFQIIPASVLIYYSMVSENVQPFPPGLRMVVGNAMDRDTGSAQSYGIDWAVDPREAEEPKGYNRKFLPNGTNIDHVPHQISGHAFFPSCGWANQSLDSVDHFSHMTWPIRDESADTWDKGGRCPDSHPIQYPSIHFESFYHFNDYHRANWRKGEEMLILANGDTTGATFHADFVNGWDVGLLEQAIKTCRSEDPDACALLGERPGNKVNAHSSCRLEGDIVDEEVGLIRPIKDLPGCNPRWGWDGPQLKPKCDEQNTPGYTSPNIQVDIIGSTSSPIALPGAKFDDTDYKSLGGCSSVHACGLVFGPWATYMDTVIDYIRKGTQQQVDTNTVQNPQNAHPTVSGLPVGAGDAAEFPATTFDMNRIPKSRIITPTAGYHTRQCPPDSYANHLVYCDDPQETGAAAAAPAAATATGAPVVKILAADEPASPMAMPISSGSAAAVPTTPAVEASPAVSTTVSSEAPGKTQCARRRRRGNRF